MLVQDGRVLLAKRSPHRRIYPDVWDAVGGHIEDGETPTEALRRELREELAVAPTVFREAGILEEPNPDRYGPAEYHVFVVTAWNGGEPSMHGSEHVSTRWWRVGDELESPLAHPAYTKLFSELPEVAGR